jgi:adenylate cyclase
MPVPFFQTLQSKFPWLGGVGSAAKEMGRPVLFTSLTLTAVLLGLRHLGGMQSMELAAYDYLVRIQPDEGEDDRFLVVGIAESDVQQRQEWPIADRTIAQLLTKLEQHQPRVIGLDVVRDIPIGEGQADLLRVLQNSDRIITVCKANATDDPGIAPPPGVAESAVGFADFAIDPGGTLRRSLLLLSPPPSDATFPNQIQHLCNNPDSTLLSLGLQLALHYLATDGIEAEFTPTEELKIGAVTFPRFEASMGGYRFADDSGYQILLHYRSQRQVAPQVSLTDVLEGRVDPALIRDRIVLIGYTTPQAKDDFYTPYSAGEDDDQKMFGVLVHAQAASQILSAVLDQRPLLWVWSKWTEAGWILAWSVTGGIIAWYARHPLKFGGGVAIAICALYGLCILAFTQGGWIPLVPAGIGLITTAVGVVLVDRFNKSTYGKNVYRQVKTFLKLNIEIDQEKLEKQVAEITESDYFLDLQQKAKALRNSPPGEPEPTSTATPTTTPTAATAPTKAPMPMLPDLGQESEQDFELDYLQQLQQESKRLREQRDRQDNENA